MSHLSLRIKNIRFITLNWKILKMYEDNFSQSLLM
jgi:hypothetical protein